MTLKKFRTAAAAAALCVGASAQLSGPSNSAPCSVLPNAALPPGSVSTVALLTVGDSVGGYRMVGIPDGMGAFLNGAGETTVLCNHELGATAGIFRAHGAKGAFVSRWTIDPATLAVTAGRDHNTAPADVWFFDRSTSAFVNGTTTWNRFCAGELAPASAFEFGGLGTSSRIFLNGEETTNGRAFAHIVSGPAMNQSWELPHLGQIAFENALASPFGQVKTIVACTDDSNVSTSITDPEPSELYFYVGNKQSTGNDVEKAGLVGGSLYGMRVYVGGVPVGGESNANCFGTSSFVGSGTFDLYNLGDASTFGGAAQETASKANDVTRFQRVEDGAWDPRPGFENDFYFLSTATVTTNSRLFRVRFTDITQPELGGTIDAILVGSEGHRMGDNMCIDADGRIFIQEDPGSNARLSKIWMYDLVNGRFTEVAAYDAAQFTVGLPGFLTTNEEASGVLDARDLLGVGWYLMASQIHKSSADPELVEGGQLMAMYVKPDLGRDFEFWFSSPAGPGTVAFNHLFGTPNAVFFTPVSLTVGNFPNGQFYGIDIAFGDLFSQFLYGAPFVSNLNASGASTSATFTALPSGLSLYGVAIDDLSALFPQVSAPVGFTVP
jgi:hypothetical protein